MTCLKNQPPVVTMKRPVVEYAMLMTYNLRKASIVYRLIDATALVGNFFDFPFAFYNQHFGQMYSIIYAGSQRVNVSN